MKITKEDEGKRILFTAKGEDFKYELFDAIIILVSKYGHVKLSYKNTMDGRAAWLHKDHLKNYTLIEELPEISQLEAENIGLI